MSIFLWAEGCSHLVVPGKSKRFIVYMKFSPNEIHILLSLNHDTQMRHLYLANSLVISDPISGNSTNVKRNYQYKEITKVLRLRQMTKCSHCGPHRFHSTKMYGTDSNTVATKMHENGDIFVRIQLRLQIFIRYSICVWNLKLKLSELTCRNDFRT